LFQVKTRLQPFDLSEGMVVIISIDSWCRFYEAGRKTK